jgi:hypothetical protein
MALSLVGIDPKVTRSYSWIGDDACNREVSAREEWLAKGTGLVAHDGQDMTEFVCAPLGPTTLSVVFGVAEGSIANLAAVNRLAVAYSVTEIKHGPAVRRVSGPGGLRLHNDLLVWLERLKVRLMPEDVEVTMLDHLGALVLGDSSVSEPEKKV